MQRVADWQQANPETNQPAGWVAAAGDAGFMALAGISGDSKYRDAMFTMAVDHWNQDRENMMRTTNVSAKPTPNYIFCIATQKMIDPLRKRFDAILAQPSTTPSLDFPQAHRARELWSWCDSLFMAPPAWLRLYAATGDSRYLDFAVTNWWRTTDFLYDKDEHLFFRDSTFFKKSEVNGRKVFWGLRKWLGDGRTGTDAAIPANESSGPTAL